MVRAHDERTAYRCSIPPEESAAQLKVGSKRCDCNVLDTSRSSFSIRVETSLCKRIFRSKHVELWFRGEKWLVAPESQYSESLEFTNVGVTRVKELTKIKLPSSWRHSFVPRFSAATDPQFLLVLMIAFIVSCIALPGIGDKLGTAPKVHRGVVKVTKVFRETIFGR